MATKLNVKPKAGSLAHMIEEVEDLLEKVKAGRVTGLAFVATTKKHAVYHSFITLDGTDSYHELMAGTVYLQKSGLDCGFNEDSDVDEV